MFDEIPNEMYSIVALSDPRANQSEEKLRAVIGGEHVEYGMHDYDFMYRIPWLYDITLYRKMMCRTPIELKDVLKSVFYKNNIESYTLNALELGAGSGAFGNLLKSDIGVRYLLGIDISRWAREAAMRDRPGLYDKYIVDDLSCLSVEGKSQLANAGFNFVCVASATGWGNHIPVSGFEAAFELLEAGGIFAFHVKPDDPDRECMELCEWIERLIVDGELELLYRNSHFHRFSSDGKEIHYDIIVGRKASAR